MRNHFVPAETVADMIRQRSASLVDSMTGSRPILPAGTPPPPPGAVADGWLADDVARARARLAEWSPPGRVLQ